MAVVYFIAGLVLLVLGAELLVAGASRLARRFGISPLVVGLTVVAFGTSAPELGVSLQAVYAGQGTIALGNVVGSNIFNVLFILGLSAVITPLVVSAQLIRFDVPVMIGVSILAYAMSRDDFFSRVDGILLFGGLIAYTAGLLVFGKAAADSDLPGGVEAWWWSVARVVGGLGLLILGARFLVDSAVDFARWMGISEQVVGLTIVAAGTSLPEVVTSIVASIRGERDIAVGNVVGSNVFNLLAVLGLSAAVAPAAIAVPEGMQAFDLPVMCGVAIVTLPMFFTGGTLARWEGAVLFGYYLAYTSYVVLAATGHSARQLLSDATLYFLLPLTILTLGVTTLLAFRTRIRENESRPPDR